ncbi:MAG: UvrD-helicase domain-containing protein [Opitutales bacterium]|nr:UvrD-helicase domain-containing protein [Opitutales bacterium]NRA26489.1 UvrD-helicase domain-containing protein [Opitutales bacterium]
MATLRDQSQRDAFIQDVRGSYSVIAPAGVGKTESIIRRIEQQAAVAAVLPEFSLDKLIVVTYTEAAAQEMRERANARLRTNRARPDILRQFEQSTFATIHGFASTLIQRWGPLFGISGEFEIIQDDDIDAVFRAFIGTQTNLLDCLAQEIRSTFTRLVDIHSILGLATDDAALDLCAPTISAFPDLRIDAFLNCSLKRSSKKLDGEKSALRAWMSRFLHTDDFVGLPETSYKAHEAPGEAFAESLAPLFDWVRDVTQQFVIEMAESFYRYRIESGHLTFSDLIRTAAELVKKAPVKEQLKVEDPHILLDEAQDTDPKQFAFLLSLVGLDVNSSGGIESVDPYWRERVAKGRFCMVGDFQQSIYRARADIGFYRNLHKALLDNSILKEAVFSVTFRCDQKVIDWVNQVMPTVFHDRSAIDEVEFVPLESRPDVKEGAVQKLVVKGSEGEHDGDPEAAQLAERLARLGTQGLGVADWSDCALLFTRKRRIQPFSEALEGHGLKVQVLSENRAYAALPEYAWWVAVLWILVEPDDSFEIVGVLREVFGVPDDVIHQFVHKSREAGEERAISIAAPAVWGGAICDILNVLFDLRKHVLALTLLESIDVIDSELDLAARLELLPGADAVGIKRARTRLQAELCRLEEKGMSLAQSVKRLRYQFLTRRMDAAAVKPGHIQLLTCHKAKGLQWNVVILTGLGSPLGEPTPQFPLFVRGEGARMNQIILNKADPSKSLLEIEKLRASEEARRLFYVAATRAKQRLVLVDNTNVLGKRSRGIPPFLSYMPEEWGEIPDFKATEAGDLTANSDSVAADGILDKNQKIQLSSFQNTARMRGPSFSSPSSKKTEDDGEPIISKVQSDEVGGREYGLLWHDWMEAVWLDGKREVDMYSGPFAHLLSQSGMRKRLDKEWQLLKQVDGLSSGLDAQDGRVLCEVPFLWRAPDDDTLYNGVVDWMRVGEGTCWIIDWKTDIVDEGLCSLIDKYADQLKIYRSALLQSLDVEVRLSLYSTRMGELIDID